MQFLIVLVVVGVCQAAILQDTPEVQAAKHRFFQEFNQVASRSGSKPSSHQTTYNHHRFEPQQYRGPLASSIPAGVDGHVTPVSETAEVRAARRAFEAAFQEQLRAVGSQKAGQGFQQHHNPIYRSSAPAHAPAYAPAPATGIWRGPLASHIPAGLPGSVHQVQNTREVEDAIAEFNRQYDQALRSARPSSVSHSSSSGHYTPSRPSYQHEQPRWTGPVAATIPAGLPGAVQQVPETHEVAAARSEFERAFQNQLYSVHG